MLDAISIALSLVWLFCFVLVVVKMFQYGRSILGIVTLVLSLFAGVGTVVAFALGWVRSTQWNIKGLMLVWTVAIITWLVFHTVYTPEWSVAAQQKVQHLVHRG